MTTLERLRSVLIAIVAFGLAGTLVELLLLAHYEEAWQLLPLVLIGLAAIALGLHASRPSAATVRGVQTIMASFVISGFVGTALHVRGASQFQWEIDKSQPRWEVFKKALRAQAPPALAPGIMIQLGLLGLASVYRHPVVKGDES